MIPEAARMRRWMLQGAPVMLLASLGMHAGGAAAGLLLWLLLGVKRLPPTPYPYPRKRQGKPWRLFFAFSTVLLFLAFLSFWGKRLLPYPSLSYFLLLWGGVLFSLPLSSRLLFVPIPEIFSRNAGAFFAVAGLFFIFYR